MSAKSVLGIGLGAAALVAAMTCVGCGPPSPEQRVDTELKATGKGKTPVYPLAGHVTIDGGAPTDVGKGRSKLMVLLYDPKMPDNVPERWLKTEVEPSGDFRFSHYGIGDGAPGGTYIVVFVQLNDKKKKGFVGPDRLKNLYNDPEKNEQKPEFKIEHKAPGKTDYEFDLAVAGQEDGTTGPKSVTKLRD
jgi:hypothetical protein